jgi:Cu2+-exporting ATPase
MIEDVRAQSERGHTATGSAHEGHEGHEPAIVRRKFWLSLALSGPTLVFSTGLQDILGLDGPRFPGSQYIPAVFGVALFLTGGRVFLRGAVGELRSRRPGMMTLISLAIVVALGYSLAVTLGGSSPRRRSPSPRLRCSPTGPPPCSSWSPSAPPS